MTDTVSALTQPPTPALETETPTPLSPQLSTPSPTPLRVDGPWLIYPGADGQHLFAADLQADLFTRLELPAAPLLSDLKTGISPDGRYLLLRTGSFAEEAGPALNLVDGADLSTRVLTNLAAPEHLRLLRAEPGSLSAQAQAALTHPEGIAWRSDAAVFPAMLESRNANLYTWAPARDSISHLAERAEQAFGPFWDPNKRSVLFQETALLTSGMSLQANQLAALDYTKQDVVRSLLRVPPGSQLSVMGWTNANYLLLYFEDEAGLYGLKLQGLAGGSPTELFPGRFDEAAFDPQNGTIVLNMGEAAAQANRQSPGIYIKTSPAANFEIMQLGEFKDLRFHPQKQLFSAANASGVAVFSASLLSFSLAGEEKLAFSNDGTWLLAWNGERASLYSPDGTHLQTLREEGLVDLFWQPDDRGFYLVSTSGLYHYRFPLLQALQISDDVWQEAPFAHTWLGTP